MDRPALGPLGLATLTSPDFEDSVTDYVTHFGYEVADRRPISAEIAGLWQAPATEDRASALLRPKSGEPGWLRIVEAAPVPGYEPLRSFGWAAMELVVADVEAVSRSLAGTVFREIGPPHDLGIPGDLRAMQVIGRAGEVVYLTQRGEIRNFAFRHVMGAVDRIFIAVLAGPDLEAARAFYETHFEVSRGLDVRLPLGILNKAHDLPEGQKHRLCTLVLAGEQEVAGKIEIDDLGAHLSPRPTNSGELPPAVGLVTFEASSLPEPGPHCIGGPRVIAAEPYAGRQAVLVRGAAGELIEIFAAGS